MRTCRPMSPNARPTAMPVGIRAQRGATSLFVTLVVLLIMMILGITGALMSGSQFKLAGNLQFENVAFNLAESSAVTAHTWLTSSGNWKNAGFTTYAGTGSNATPYLYPVGSFTSDPLTMSWSDSNSCALNSSNVCAAVGSGGDDSRRYIIQKIAANQTLLGASVETGGRASSICQKADLFRVTARGTSARGTTKFIQTTYEIPSC